MENNVKRVKVGLIVGKMVGGGVESVLLDMLRYIDNNKYSFDFIVDSDSTLVPEKTISELGGRVIYIPPYQDIFRYMWKMYHLFKKENYTIVHANISAMNVFPLFVASSCSIPIRIAHNHNLIAPGAGIVKNTTKKLLSNFNNIFANYRIAPTNATGKWMFRKLPFDVVSNGIDAKKFCFSVNSRNKIRNEFGINGNELLIGSFGRIVKLKNIPFVISVFQNVLRKNKDARLLLIGDGPEKEHIKELIASKGFMNNKVIFLDSQENIEEFYSALDVYLFPSSAEAFGMAAVEAQMSGLMTYVSMGVPDEAKISGKLFRRIVQYDAHIWGASILGDMDKLSNRYLISKSLVQDNKLASTKMALKVEKIYDRAVLKYEQEG